MTAKGAAVATAPRLGGLLRSFAHRMTDEPVPLPDEGGLPSLEGASRWLNSPPLAPEDLTGRVVLVNFWTYTCINWIRTLPYLQAWDSRYRDHGLTIIGVHTPEFGFEHDLDNVIAAIEKLEVPYPVAVDNAYEIWRALDNNFWPATYIADRQGRIRYHHFGEGEYPMTEMVIQRLLSGEGNEPIDLDLTPVEPSGLALAADWHNLRTPETYLGSARISGFVSEGRSRFGEPRDYSVPMGLGFNHWALGGKWTIEPHAATLHEPKGRVAFRFYARDLNLVMGPVEPETSVAFRVSLDGMAPGRHHGVDVDDRGSGIVAGQGLYQLIRQTDSVEDRLFEIEFEEAGVEAYSFTFG